MKHRYFSSIENLPEQSEFSLQEVMDQLVFNEQGLIPVITQDANSKDVLMFAWMNAQALEQTLLTRKVTYWTRSRQKLWVKGESSGHFQTLVNMSFDCDGDVILCQVHQVGAACHTGRENCFYLNVDLDKQRVVISGDANP